MINMFSTSRVSQNSSIEQQTHKRCTSSDPSVSLFYEILNISYQNKQDFSQPSSLEHDLKIETLSARDATNINMDSPQPVYASIHQIQSESAQRADFAQAKGESPNDSEIERPNETDKPNENPLYPAHKQTQTKEVEAESSDATLLKESLDSKLLRLQFVSQPQADKEGSAQRCLQTDEKPVIDIFNLKKDIAEPVRLSNPSKTSDEKNPLRFTVPAFVNLEDIEVLNENTALEYQQLARLVKNLKDVNQPTFLNLSSENGKIFESSSPKGDVSKQTDVHIFKNVSDIKESAALKSPNEPSLNVENHKQLVSERVLGAQKGSTNFQTLNIPLKMCASNKSYAQGSSNFQALNINRYIDVPTLASLRSETLTAQDLADTRVQGILQTVELVEGIKEKIMLMVRGQDERAVFKLHPPELGRLEIRLKLLDKSCQADILVQNPLVKSLIESSANELARGLQNANLELAGLFVSLESDDNKKESSANDGSQFSPNEKIKEISPIKKRTIQTQRVNRLSNTSVDIII